MYVVSSVSFESCFTSMASSLSSAEYSVNFSAVTDSFVSDTEAAVFTDDELFCDTELSPHPVIEANANAIIIADVIYVFFIIILPFAGRVVFVSMIVLYRIYLRR